MIRVMTVDDNPGMRLLIRRMVERVSGFVLASEAENGAQALRLAQEERPDVVFMDVEMPGEIDGIECARRMQDLDPGIVILFATAHEGFRREAFALYAFDYLVKPFDVKRVEETLGRIRERREALAAVAPAPAIEARGPGRKLLIRQKESVNLIDAADVLLIQREDRATAIYTRHERLVTSETLAELMERLPPERFMRCHKSYIINLDSVYRIFPYGRWTYIVKLRETDKDALMTHEKFEELQQRYR